MHNTRTPLTPVTIPPVRRSRPTGWHLVWAEEQKEPKVADGNKAHLVLTDENQYAVELADWATQANQHGRQWVTRQLISHAHPSGRPGLVLLAGARAVFLDMSIDGHYECLLTFGAGLPELSRDGLQISVSFREDGSGLTTELLRETVLSFNADSPWVERRLDLAPLAHRRGKFVIACDPVAERDGRSDRLALYEFVVSPAEELSLSRARAFAAFREKNEISVFSDTYDHPIYNEGAPRPSGPFLKALKGKATALLHYLRAQGRPRANPGAPEASSSAEESRSAAVETVEPESPGGNAAATAGARPNLYQYYTSRLMHELGIENIDFRGYLARRLKTHPDRSIRILSLASGAARIEEGIIDGFDPHRIELTLTDINPGLLAKAKTRLANKARAQSMVMNVNQLCLPSRAFDIILCVSALHHVVELERVMAQAAAALVEDGEFWSIGEYVGRNGTRLFEDAYCVADGFFRQLPRKYRINRNPGSSRKLDERLPNSDCSITCFEGIRSEEIEAVMARDFVPVEVIKFDCFLWRLFNLAYLDNYDLDREEDREIVEKAVRLETEFVHSGGRPTAMWGVYRGIRGAGSSTGFENTSFISRATGGLPIIGP